MYFSRSALFRTQAWPIAPDVKFVPMKFFLPLRFFLTWIKHHYNHTDPVRQAVGLIPLEKSRNLSLSVFKIRILHNDQMHVWYHSKWSHFWTAQTHEDGIVYILKGFLILLRFGITIIPSQNLQIASPNSKNTHAALYCGGIRSLWIVEILNYIHSSDQLWYSEWRLSSIARIHGGWIIYIKYIL